LFIACLSNLRKEELPETKRDLYNFTSATEHRDKSASNMSEYAMSVSVALLHDCVYMCIRAYISVCPAYP